MEDRNKRPSSVTSQPTPTYIKDPALVFATSIGPSSNNGEHPSLPASRVRQHAIQMVFLEAEVRAAAQRAYECTENEQLAADQRFEADRQASLAVQRFYIARRAYEDEATALSGSPHSQLQRSRPQGHLHQLPSPIRMLRQSSTNPNFPYGLSSIIFEQETAHRAELQSGPSFGSETIDLSKKAQDSGVDKLNKGKEKAQSPPPPSRGPSAFSRYGAQPQSSAFSSIISLAAAQNAVVGSTPSRVVSAPPTMQSLPNTLLHIGSTPSTGGTRGAPRHRTEEDITFPTIQKEPMAKVAPPMEQQGHPLTKMDVATLEGGSSTSTVAEPSNQSTPGATGIDFAEITNAFAAFSEEELSDFNFRLEDHMERMFICATCLPGCACRLVDDKPFPSGPPSPT
ncbi:hypothetical protein CPB83DRAFT_838838 [Crepidotus variabilis]|uniref:Uncharacterized protein n=1 Tax=Crepidotus variabilis TaxID=179855 RepID=A0A9P6JKT5_9AGAR|nr:hypothetical protein CPB83DRAFT_838838 [Crepidotus variabilis]